MEKSQETSPKRIFYLINAMMVGAMDGKRISATMVRNVSTLDYKFGDHIETLLITKDCGNHIFESEESVYIIMDRSL